MNVKFPVLKVGSTFYRNGTLFEVVEMDKVKLIMQDLFTDENISINLKTLRAQFSNHPGQLEVIPQDIARKEAARVKEMKGQGSMIRGRKPLDLRAAGLHDWLVQNCQTRNAKRYQTNYTMSEGFDVVLYRRTPRIDFVHRTGEVRLPWAGTLPRGIKHYQLGDPYLKTRKHLKAHIVPRSVRNDALCVVYTKKIVAATLKAN